MDGGGHLTEVDARGLPCPLPIVRLAAAIRRVAHGARLTLSATDPAVEKDLIAWCEATGHTLVRVGWAGETFHAEVQKAASLI